MNTIQLTVDWDHVGVKSAARRAEQTIVEMGKGATSHSEDSSPSPMEVFLASLGGCIIVFISGLAEKRRITIDDISIFIEGDYDPQGMSSSSSGIRPGFQQIRYQVRVDSPDNPDKVHKIVDYAVKACPIKDTIMKGTAIIESKLVRERDMSGI
jgi:uncharacterized OsmC-like protein